MEQTEFKKTVSDWIRSQYVSSDESLRRTFRFNDVYDLLKEGITHFWFRKRDGSLRSAYGTLVMDIIARHGGIPDGKERFSKRQTDSGQPRWLAENLEGYYC